MECEKEMIKLGSKVKDSITGFTGIATARTEYLYGCVRITVEPTKLKGGQPAECQHFDEQRLLADLNPMLQEKAELTTVEASRLLGVSRQFFINLLSRGEIPFHMVGTHRRICTKDVLVFKANRDGERKQGLEDLIEAEIEEGIF